MTSFEQPPVEKPLNELSPAEQIAKLQQQIKDNAGLAELGKAIGHVRYFNVVMELVQEKLLKDDTDKNAVANAMAEVSEAMTKYAELAPNAGKAEDNTNVEQNLNTLFKEYERKLHALWEIVQR